MGKPLRLLLVENDERDAALVLRELKRGGFDVTYERVETAETMSAALVSGSWDLIISDYTMPRFSAPMALAVLKGHGIDLPFIIVSGTVGEDIAVAALHAGAHDFVAKGKLLRLIPAIERELRDVALRAERTQMKEQLLISERMASVGTLAAGVAHEINNPLAALTVNVQLAQGDLRTLIEKAAASLAAPNGGGGAELAERTAVVTQLKVIDSSLEDAQEAADRVRGIVKDLKLFSRSEEEEKTGPVDVVQVLKSSVRMAVNEIRHRARLVEEYDDVPPVEGLQGQLGQVFLNLIVNAAQAIPEGNADHDEIRVSTRLDPRGWVVVEIRDTGSGIPETIVSRIFDPFFTTKPVGVGTGLGLSICHRIVTGLGGQIGVESVVGKGTTFRITLPVALTPLPTAETTEPEEVSPVPTAPPRRGRILVVDDEPMLGNALTRVLALAHDAVAVTSARDALARLLGGERYDVIICDLMMPDMTGMDLHAELSRAAPELARHMVFMTGGAFTNRARAFLDQAEIRDIEKPVNTARLLSLVRETMDRT